MLLERAAGLADKIGRYQKLKAAASEADLFRTRATQIGEAATLLAEARATLRRFANAGVTIDFSPVNAADLIEKSVRLRAIAADDPAGLANPPFNVAHEFTNRLKGLAVAANAAIESGWQRYVEENGPGGSDEILEALSKLPQLRAGVAHIRQCRQKVLALAVTLPADPARAADQLRDLTNEHRAAWTVLAADSLPAGVVAFLRSCAGEGAPIAALTREVRDWLEARDLLGSFRIRIG
jgi:hypothetical protein